MRVVLIVQYDGTNYCGWQTQPNGATIQQTIEQAFFNTTGEKINLVGSGRTDSGVHAKGQVAHFDTMLSQPAESFSYVLNAVLPNDIKIIKSFKADDDFHARYSAKRKTYVYRTYISKIELPLKNRYSTRINEKLNIEAVKTCAKLIQGTHDFASFCSSGSSVKDTTRTVYEIKVNQSGNDLEFSVCGNGFLYNMVRIIVGALLEVGYGKLSISDVENALKNRNRETLGKTMPPNGLTLDSVDYENIKI